MSLTRLFFVAAATNVWVLVGCLALAFGVQFALGEIPCRLCLLQRIALMMCAIGPLHILLSARDGKTDARNVAIGCGLAIAAALFGASVSGRQVLMHIAPNDPGFGSAVLGLHLYTWGLIAFIGQIVVSAAMLVAVNFLERAVVLPERIISAPAAALALVLTANLVLTFAEAGLHWEVPEDPVTYLLFGRAAGSGANG